jgi:hypothetical protein
MSRCFSLPVFSVRISVIATDREQTEIFMRMRWLFSLAVLSTALPVVVAQDPLPRLKVSDNKRFLVTSDNRPFFYLGDTAWELFHRLNRVDAEKYLDDRQKRGFNVIQAVVLAELDGLTDPTPDGQLPLVKNDPLRPNEKYFEHVDWIIDAANKRGIYIGLLPTWGDKWNKKWGTGPEIFTPENAAAYGEWLGKRYKNKGIIWILGGDRPVESETHKRIIRAMAGGLRKGDGGAHLMTFHPMGGGSSSQYFHEDNWLDFNMRQNGHGGEYTGRYDQTKTDYDRKPTKPVIDGEPIYEDHPVSFRAKDLGHSIAADCRRAFYWDVFNGACGHTYGHHSVWQMYDKSRKPINNPLLEWSEAIKQPGADQMRHGKALIESRPYLSRIPDDSVIVPSGVATSIPGAGTRRFVATRDEKGTYAMVYSPVGRPFHVAMGKIADPVVKAWWFNPRDGSAMVIGEFPNTGNREFMPPNPGEQIDWVLLLDAKSADYPPPARAK